MKKVKYFLIIYYILIIFYLHLWYEIQIPWILIYPNIVYRKYDIQNAYKIRSYDEKRKFISYIQNILVNKTHLLTKNDYPYNVRANHYVLWLNKYIDKKNITEILEQYLNTTDFFYYENPINKRSIPEIIHYQVFSKL